MPARKATHQPAEPLGIVISNGDRNDPPPFFWSYEWSDVPEQAKPKVKARVA